MHNAPHITALLHRLWAHIAPRRRLQLFALFVFMLLASCAEVFSLGAVLPFLGVLTTPERLFHHPLLQPYLAEFGLATPQALLLPMTVIFSIGILVAGGMRLTLLWINTRLSFAVGTDLSSSMYRRTLYQPYAQHVARNSSEVIAAISTKAHNVIYQTLVPMVNLAMAIVMLTAILLALLAMDPVIACATYGGFGAIYFTIVRLSRRKLREDSQHIARESTRTIKALQEGLGGIRDVLIDGTQPIYYHNYRTADLALRRAQGSNLFIAQSPRFSMEALGMLLIVAIAYGLALQPNGIATAIPTLGALALGAQRLLPMVQQAYAAWSTLLGGQASLRDTLTLLEQPLPASALLPPPAPIAFQQTISLRNLSFRYSADTPWILRHISLTIPKRSRIGMVGTTGSGKSTLTDILMALLTPTEGGLYIDDVPITAENQRAWQAHIAHVPQSIFLADSSIAENIAFGVPVDSIDHARVREVAQQAQIAATIESWVEGYHTQVGERGVRLSGGQRQRIGIARALYKRADVLIFDEATSALDHETEHSVLQAIEQLSEDITIIMVAHRTNTLARCDRIIDLGGVTPPHLAPASVQTTPPAPIAADRAGTSPSPSPSPHLPASTD